MNILNIFKNIIAGIKADGFDWKDIVVPLVIEFGKKLAQEILDGEKVNPTWIAVIQFANYGTYQFHDLLVGNPDTTYTDEFIRATREVFQNAADEGNFYLDIPDHME